MKYRVLSHVCEYRKDRIFVDNVNENNYISTENMLPNKGGVEKASSIPEGKTFPAYQEGDILLSNIRPYFKKIWFANKKGGCSNDVLVLKTNNSVDNKFLYYVLADNNFFNYATVTSKGTKMPRGSKTAIMKYLVPDVDISTQKQIADILSTYDDLIENNNRRIALLEKAAQELYKEWFVRFRFPGHETAKFENGLPEGWKIAKLGSLCKIITGKKDANEATGQGIYPFFTCARETTLFTDEYILDTNAILISGNGSYTGLVKKHSGKFDLYQRTYALYDFQNIEWLYLYWTMKIDFEREFMGGSRGSAIPYITRPNIEKFKIIVPPQDIMERAQRTFEQIHNECLYLDQQNKNLAKQRDLLLPRLMSGKLEV